MSTQEKNIFDDADYFHFPLHHFPLGTGHLLDNQQHPDHRPTILHLPHSQRLTGEAPELNWSNPDAYLKIVGLDTKLPLAVILSVSEESMFWVPLFLKKGLKEVE